MTGTRPDPSLIILFIVEIELLVLAQTTGRSDKIIGAVKERAAGIAGGLGFRQYRCRWYCIA